jgi:hypothetical protein
MLEEREVWPGRPELIYREYGHVSQHVTVAMQHLFSSLLSGLESFI